MISAFETYFTSLKGKKIAVLGLGVSNRPLVRLLLEFGCDVVGCDRTPREKLDAEVLELESLGCKLHVGETYLEGVEADLLFRTPGMHPANPAIEALRSRGAEVTSEMEVFFEVCPCHLLAVTGSDGKTTTTTLVSEMLKAAGKTVWLGGNIGTPLLPLVREMKADDFAVVELSSFQLMDMRRSPERAIITNLAPNHLDVHKDMEEYVESKKNIYRYQDEKGLLILNADNAMTAALKGNGETKFFSRQGRGYVELREGVIFRGETAVLPVADILLPGVHNIENYMAAIAMVEGLVEDEVIRSVAKNFGGVEHRIELVRIKDGVKFYNDSIASSPSRTIAGLRSFSEKVILIAGGYDKHIPYDVLGPEICAHVKKLFLGGATGKLIREAVEKCAEFDPNVLEILDCETFEPAVRAAAAAAREGDIVLMSPASAAFDQFKNFMVRGEFYKKLVKEL
ncbi:MAG: UDP-N-acetylmuramoyl-L-alanine--D-glutamate ligase [Oscillospiraceae bacterium]|nr:UDP-N-acetylmuramoyl-L-alanine--D-glutamate ligase [Oscillospiraceae bacterium]